MYRVRKYNNVLANNKLEGTRKKMEMHGITGKDVSNVVKWPGL